MKLFIAALVAVAVVCFLELCGLSRLLASMSKNNPSKTAGLVPTKWYNLPHGGNGKFGDDEIDEIHKATGVHCKVTKNRDWMTSRMLRMYAPPCHPADKLARARNMVNKQMEQNHASLQEIASPPKKKAKMVPKPLGLPPPKFPPAMPAASSSAMPAMPAMPASSSTFNPFAAMMQFMPMMMMMSNPELMKQCMPGMSPPVMPVPPADVAADDCDDDGVSSPSADDFDDRDDDDDGNKTEDGIKPA